MIITAKIKLNHSKLFRIEKDLEIKVTVYVSNVEENIEKEAPVNRLLITPSTATGSNAL